MDSWSRQTPVKGLTTVGEAGTANHTQCLCSEKGDNEITFCENQYIYLQHNIEREQQERESNKSSVC